MTDLKTRTVPAGELRVGDVLEFMGKSHRITSFEPYDGPLSDIVSRVIHVEGHGAFMVDDGNPRRILA